MTPYVYPQTPETTRRDVDSRAAHSESRTTKGRIVLVLSGIAYASAAGALVLAFPAASRVGISGTLRHPTS